MNKKEFNLYVAELKKEFDVSISDDLLEKDYVLSLFLSNWNKVKTPALDKLIFKGGTLLTKNYLKYHRISEDLDFTHEDSNELRIIPTKGKQETQIKNRVKLIIDEIKKIAEMSELDFQIDRSNDRYIMLRNSRKLYIFNLYYKSVFTNMESYIKFEVSFVEDLINNSLELEINNIVENNVEDYSTFLKITNYDLEKPILQVYSIEEIILEKIRATMTREQFKPRDVFDLYLINKNIDIFGQNKKDIFRKLYASPFEQEIVSRNISNFVKEEIVIDLDDIYNLSLIKIDESEILLFTDKLIEYLKMLVDEFLEEKRV